MTIYIQQVEVSIIFLLKTPSLICIGQAKTGDVYYVTGSLIVSFCRKHGKEYFTMCVVSIPGQSQHAAMARM